MYSTRFVALVALFVTTLVVSNIIAVKLVAIGGLVFPAALVIFPLSYILGDVLTEVYGYAAARRVIWLGFACNVVAVVAIAAGQVLPPAPFWADAQAAYERVLGYSPRLLAASFAAYLVGEFANALVLSRLKIATRGRWLWMRTLGSTLIGQALDSAVFIAGAFLGMLPSDALVTAILTQWSLKVAYEAAATPVTYVVVNALKRTEGIDSYDYGADLSPLTLR
jgi:uncharacterized integral membrane protein (TIGR00697 family)